MFRILALLLVGLEAWSTGPVDPRCSSGYQLVESRTLTSGGNRFTEHYSHLVELVRKSNLEPKEKDLLLESLQAARERAHENPVFFDSLRRLDTESSVLVCGFNGCEFKRPATARYETLGEDFTTMSLYVEGEPSREAFRKSLIALQPKKSWAKTLERGLSRDLAAVFVRLPPDLTNKDSRVHLVNSLYHELVHHADTLLLSEWVKANGKLLAEGKPTDFLFNNYVKVYGDRVYLDKDFYLLFLESRGYGVSAQIMKQINPQAAASYAGLGLANLPKQSQGTTNQIVRDLGVHSNNFFNRGIELGLILDRTIAVSRGQASELASPEWLR